MNPLEARLREVAADLGEHDPANTYFQKLLGLSSGRITQLFTVGSISKLGPKPLRILVAKGYNPEWIQEGAPHQKMLSTPTGTTRPEAGIHTVDQIIAAFDRLDKMDQQRVQITLDYKARLAQLEPPPLPKPERKTAA